MWLAPLLSILLYHIPELHSLLWLSHTPLYRYPIFYLSRISWWTWCYFHFFGYYERCCCELSCTQSSCGYMFSFLLSIYIRMIFLGHVLTLMFNILGSCQNVFYSSCTILHPTSNVWRLHSLHTLANTCFCLPLNRAILLGIKSGISLWSQ